MAARTIQGAAELASPGTRKWVAWRGPGSTATLLPLTETRAPMARSIRSALSRLGAGSRTRVGPCAPSPASSMHDFTWALATGMA